MSPFLTSEQDETSGNKTTSEAVPTSEQSCPGEGFDVLDPQDQVRFEMLVLPHLDAAFNLARWLLRSGADAEDVAQEAMLRVPFLPWFSWRRCARLAAADRAEHLLHLAGEGPQHPKCLLSQVTIASASRGLWSLCRHVFES